MQLSPIDRNGSCTESKWPQLQRNAHCDTVHASDIVLLLFACVKRAGFLRTEKILLHNSFRVRFRSHEHNEVLLILQQQRQL